MKYTLNLLFLYNAEMRYALPLRHLSNKIQSGYVTRKHLFLHFTDFCHYQWQIQTLPKNLILFVNCLRLVDMICNVTKHEYQRLV